MNDFQILANKIDEQIQKMLRCEELYRVDVAKNELYHEYLEAIPVEHNSIYKTNREYDCICCKHFIRDVGSMVAIKNGKMITIWDVKVDGFFQDVVNLLASTVKSKKIKTLFSVHEYLLGEQQNQKELDNGEIVTFYHFHTEIPASFVQRGGSTLSSFDSKKKVLIRAFDEIDPLAVETILELIGQNSLYRGEEFRNMVSAFGEKQEQYRKASDAKKDLLATQLAKSLISGIRNSVIGTLLVDLSEGKELTSAVGAYEAKVAPSNYKRPTALITKTMVDKAMGTIDELGLERSLERRLAKSSDIILNDILFVDRDETQSLKDGLRESLLQQVKPLEKQTFDKVEEISIEDFIRNVLPKAEHLEVMVENKHSANLMSLTAPKHEDAPGLFKWNNGFSWSYSGGFADSVIERVKKAGGSVSGEVRVSLSWFNTDDLDLSCACPDGEKIYFGIKKHQKTLGELDVDMNISIPVRDAVENITWPRISSMLHGKYKIIVDNYNKRESIDVGFDLQVQIRNEIYNFSYPKAVVARKIYLSILVNDGVVEIVDVHKDLKSKSSSQDLWNIKTETFQKVSLMTLSPNHWGEERVGNKHYMFILKDCKNPDKVRGFYNEYLKQELNDHRKVFEVLASKTMCDKSEEQLSGLGFSSTVRNSLLCKVSGKFNRMLKINF